jgi:uncharacterized membrane protein
MIKLPLITTEASHGYNSTLHQVLVFLYFSFCFGYLLLGCYVISVSYIICVLTLLLMPLAGLHFYVRLDFVTPSL